MSAPATERAATEEGSSSHSGRLLLRMPQTLHAELASAAEREGVSLNAFITSTLAGAVRWRQDGAADPPGHHPARARTLRIVLIANLTMVAIAAAVAIALLVIAWP